MELFQGDVGKVLADMSMKNESLPDAVMVDPPRAGLDPKAIQYILALNAPQLLYISCNPATQAANLEILLREGYCLKVVQPIDQFPQTPHIENIVILTR
jgi:23S rRNA (uracil1939-C5)-methyltransferase